MKKIPNILIPLVFAGILVIAQPGQQGKGNSDNKGRKENASKNNSKAKTGNQPQEKAGQPGKTKGVVNPGKDNNPGKGKNNVARAGKPGNAGNPKIEIDREKNNLPVFTRENFRNRKDFWKGEKVTICHKAQDGNAVTISVSANALQAHLAHGDSQGACTYTSGTFSDIFISRREKFFDQRERTRDQVMYSQGILEYALQRLTEERNELTLLRSQNANASSLSRQETYVTELETNVSLLQTLLGTALTLLTD